MNRKWRRQLPRGRCVHRYRDKEIRLASTLGNETRVKRVDVSLCFFFFFFAEDAGEHRWGLAESYTIHNDTHKRTNVPWPSPFFFFFFERIGPVGSVFTADYTNVVQIRRIVETFFCCTGYIFYARSTKTTINIETTTHLIRNDKALCSLRNRAFYDRLI